MKLTTAAICASQLLVAFAAVIPTPTTTAVSAVTSTSTSGQNSQLPTQDVATTTAGSAVTSTSTPGQNSQLPTRDVPTHTLALLDSIAQTKTDHFPQASVLVAEKNMPEEVKPQKAQLGAMFDLKDIKDEKAPTTPASLKQPEEAHVGATLKVIEEHTVTADASNAKTLEGQLLSKIINKKVDMNSPDVRIFLAKFTKMLDFIILHPGQPYEENGLDTFKSGSAAKTTSQATRVLLSMVDSKDFFYTPEEVDFFFGVIRMVEKVIPHPDEGCNKACSLHIEQLAQRALIARAVRAFGIPNAEHGKTYPKRDNHDHETARQS